MKNELVSIIISAYNENIEWFEKSINSLQTQTHTNIEIILFIDNPKNSELINFAIDISEKDSRIKLFINEKNQGLVFCLNKGISLCSGNIIARMDADDISDCRRLEKQLHFLKTNPDYVLVGTQLNLIDEKDRLLNKKILLPCSYKHIKKIFNYTNVICHPSIMFRKDFINQIGGYRDIIYAEDYDLVARIILNGGKVANLKEHLINYRIRYNGITQSNKIIQIHSQLFVKKYYRKKRELELLDKYYNSNNLRLSEKVLIIKDKIIYKVYLNLLKI